jgi:ThiF family
VALPEPSQELREGRRAIISIEGVTLLRDWEWHNGLRKWFLSCRLAPDLAATAFVPAVTDWFVLVSPSYPWGSIKFHPAKQGGLAHTFPHQSFEKETSRYEVPWRRGCLCLDTPTKSLGRQEYTIEPYDPQQRLSWHCKRALAWLIDASRGELIKPGEPFELPQYPIDQTSPLSIAFSEAPESYATWQEAAGEFGFVDFYVLRREISVQVVKAFKTLGGGVLLMPDWGPGVTQGASVISHGFWFRLRETPVLEPWQAPTTWAELRDNCRQQGFDLDDRLRLAIESVKQKDKIGQIALFGFPIPEIVGQGPERMHWLGINLPTLVASDVQVPGFRKGKQSSWKHNRSRLLRGSSSIRWLGSENWSPDQLQTRGRLSKDMISKRILLLGAGALGSSLAELLVRAGVHSMLVMDDDRLEAGNLVRHTLTLNELNRFKAESLAKRLNDVTPSAHIECLNSAFPPATGGAKARINDCEIVIDCTGSDEVLQELSSLEWNDDRLFFSLSFSLGARTLFCFVAQGRQFPNDVYRQQINPWLIKDREEYGKQELPREGVGCWHPVFPARADDVWLFAAAAVKCLESAVLSPPSEPQLVVFEQELTDNGEFIGVKRSSENLK